MHWSYSAEFESSQSGLFIITENLFTCDGKNIFSKPLDSVGQFNTVLKSKNLSPLTRRLRQFVLKVHQDYELFAYTSYMCELLMTLAQHDMKCHIQPCRNINCYEKKRKKGEPCAVNSFLILWVILGVQSQQPQ